MLAFGRSAKIVFGSDVGLCLSSRAVIAFGKASMFACGNVARACLCSVVFSDRFM